jgi:hypothetical protein
MPVRSRSPAPPSHQPVCPFGQLTRALAPLPRTPDAGPGAPDHRTWPVLKACVWHGLDAGGMGLRATGVVSRQTRVRRADLCRSSCAQAPRPPNGTASAGNGCHLAGAQVLPAQAPERQAPAQVDSPHCQAVMITFGGVRRSPRPASEQHVRSCSWTSADVAGRRRIHRNRNQNCTTGSRLHVSAAEPGMRLQPRLHSQLALGLLVTTELICRAEQDILVCEPQFDRSH